MEDYSNRRVYLVLFLGAWISLEKRVTFLNLSAREPLSQVVQIAGNEPSKEKGGVEAGWIGKGPILDEDTVEPDRNVIFSLSRSFSDSMEIFDTGNKVLKWIWSDHDDGSIIDVQSHTAELRNRSVRQILDSGQSACRELNIFYVTALRILGIPARHCSVGRWLHRDSFHFFAEYWDAVKGEWVTVDTSDDKFLTAESPAERVANGRWNSLVYYAYPGNPDEPDLYGKGRWDKMVNITGDLAEEFPMEIVWPDLEKGGTLSAQIWNGGSWRTILIQEVKAGEASVVVKFGKTHVTTRPVMFSADIEGERYLAMVKAAELDHQVVLEKVEGEQALGWSPGEVPKEVGE